MYKLIKPFENDKIYNNDISGCINEIYKDLKYLNINNLKITIKDVKTGCNYSYCIINKKNNKIKI